MSYVITDGKRYCHRTKTRAVEIVNDLDSATRFANKDMAQNILQRATKKLSGFSLMELPSVSAKETPAKAKTREAAEKNESTNAPARKGRPAKKQTEAPVTDQQEKQQVKQEEKQQEKSAPSPKKTEDAAAEIEEKSGRSETRKKTHRGGRRRKNASQETASAEQAAEQSAKVEEIKPDAVEAEPVKTDKKAEKASEVSAPAASSSPKPVLPPSFRMEIRGGASGQKAAPEKELPETAPAVNDPAKESDTSAVLSEETAASAESSADMTVQPDPPSQPEQNRSRKSGRSRRGGRKNRTEANQQDSAQQNADQQEAAAPEKPAAPVIPMFTVKTHHVSENAVARPVRTEQAPKESSQAIQKQPVAAAMSVPEQAAQATEDKTLVIETAHVTDAPKAGQSNDSGRDSGRSRTTGRSRSGRGGRSREDQGRESSSARESAEKKSASETEAKSSETSRSRAKGRSKSVSSTEAKRRIFTTQERYEIYNRTEGHCGICGKFIPLGEYTIDHIIPLSKGGTNDLDNLQACCSFCNKAKDDSMGDEFFQRIQNIFLYQAQLKFGKKKLKKLKKALDEIEE